MKLYRGYLIFAGLVMLVVAIMGVSGGFQTDTVVSAATNTWWSSIEDNARYNPGAFYGGIALVGVVCGVSGLLMPRRKPSVS